MVRVVWMVGGSGVCIGMLVICGVVIVCCRCSIVGYCCCVCCGVCSAIPMCDFVV